jgi:hypothetical protein
VLKASDSDAVTDYSDGVDSNGCGGHPIRSAPFTRENPQAREFRRRYCFERVPVPARATRLDLDKRDGCRESRDDVDFSVTTPPPTIENLVPVRDEKVASDDFAPAPEFMFECHCSSPIRVGYGLGI